MLYAVCSLEYIQPHTTGACKHCLGCSQFVVTQQELQQDLFVPLYSCPRAFHIAFSVVIKQATLSGGAGDWRIYFCQQDPVVKMLRSDSFCWIDDFKANRP